MPPYVHRQVSVMSRLTFIPVAAVVAFLTLSSTNDPLPMIVILSIVLLLLASVVVIFSTLTVVVKDGVLTVSFPFGLFRKSFALADVARVERTHLPWYYGMGLKWEGDWRRDGMHSTITYLAQGGPAVALVFRAGNRLQIGTDDPDGLTRAVMPAA